MNGLIKSQWLKFNGFINVKIDRDSVHPGDDVQSHATTLRVPSTATLGAFLLQVRQTNYLPGIHGGKATWLINLTGNEGKCIGVVAEEWNEPKLTIPADTPVKTLLHSNPSGFIFRYWCQANPETVFSSVLYGKELPDRYGRPIPPGISIPFVPGNWPG